MWNNSLQTFVIGIIMTAGVSLSACDSSKPNVVEEVASDLSSNSAAEQQSKPAADTDLDGATVGQGQPVNYNVSTWGQKKVAALNIEELDKIKSTFGKVVSTDENSLDYASNPATKYRFMKTDAPYLDVIDSQKYLELGWYYANPSDSNTEKELSRAHAKKAYKLARQLMGDEGGKVLSDMLSGQIIKNQTVGGQKIELAKCEFYSCMLVLNKSDAQTADS
jgi:endonuclease YncB( thermonuclease family)